ncbi:hypothetical protein DFH07DRAFT_858644 [Mycena maculata]|uniref:Thioesterase domain-containing protein n=1 Tax=Mycena maculata TaxID=230809 RepID=A0AAD7HHK1_9AGAR|nr:hypothetical protein DFH07DRAFT_858644 [Mycena maculata]
MPFDSNAAMARILGTSLPDAMLSQIEGNAPRDVKEMAVKWLDIFHAPPKCFAGASTRKTAITEVSLDPNPLEDTRILTMVCELDVMEDILDGEDKLSNAFIVVVIDECVSSAVTALDYAEGGPGICGVSQSLNTVFHNPVALGAKLRFINTTLAATSGTTSCRSEVWDVTQRRLVATAVFVGMSSSPPKSQARL